MRHLFVIASFVMLSLSALAASSNFANEKKLALDILLKATQFEATADTYRKMVLYLYTANIHTPPSGQNFSECKADTLAYVLPYKPDDIYICSTLLGQPSLLVAQVLVHESAHLIGVHDECQATTFEFFAMKAAGLSLLNRSYADQCGLSIF